MSEESSKFIEAIGELWPLVLVVCGTFLIWIFRKSIEEILPKLTKVKTRNAEFDLGGGKEKEPEAPSQTAPGNFRETQGR